MNNKNLDENTNFHMVELKITSKNLPKIFDKIYRTVGYKDFVKGLLIWDKKTSGEQLTKKQIDQLVEQWWDNETALSFLNYTLVELID
ncbi:hypothetical protein [Mycoplasma mycoides]|uniref:hypothetical protein n=1 Tax=Mycoplasma mycoides TaxID=2102 RepID=UPI00223F6C39|nr:hypothetical protein [Mycoplasma mycoides]QVJ96024.1 hypothetical protein I7632_03245 [Mycoplasma mycoides subsp. capri]QVJ96918.1 hypothetical protein I7633_03200 [Mycoplasma mycoides subsp. capri]QVK00781.1 hypothetical protein I7635_03195 [Mycoplasma mycoides subsp. capri]